MIEADVQVQIFIGCEGNGSMCDQLCLYDGAGVDGEFPDDLFPVIIAEDHLALCGNHIIGGPGIGRNDHGFPFCGNVTRDGNLSGFIHFNDRVS